MTLQATPPRFSPEEFDRAHDDWGANCGPGAIAAICGLTLDELRPHLGDFERKRYTNPTLMFGILRRLYDLGVVSRRSFPNEVAPQYGLVRVQWHGPWMRAGVPIAARYRHTHWIGVAHRPGENGAGDTGVFDINALGNGTGWVRKADWLGIIVPAILQHCVPGADGGLSYTHAIEIEQMAQPKQAVAV